MARGGADETRALADQADAMERQIRTLSARVYHLESSSGQAKRA